MLLFTGFAFALGGQLCFTFLICGFPCLIGVHDAGDHRMAHHVFAMEEVKADLIDFRQHFDGMAQTGFGAAWQVNLRDVAGDHRLGVKADAGQEHLHLFDGGVLAFIKNDKGVIQRPSAHIGQRGHFDDVTLNQLLHFLKAEHLKQRVIQRAQIRVDLLAQIAGQEAELFACLDGRTGQQNTADLTALQRIDRRRHRQIGFTRTRRTHAESDVVIEDIGDVLRTVRRTRFDYPRLVLILTALPYSGTLSALCSSTRASLIAGGSALVQYPESDRALALCRHTGCAEYRRQRARTGRDRSA